MTSPRARTARILSRFAGQVPRLSVDRARYFTQSFRSTEHLPLVMRWARALAHVMENMAVQILPDELIVGLGASKPSVDLDAYEREYKERVAREKGEVK